MVATESLLRTLVYDPAGDDQYLTTEEYDSIIALESGEYRAAAAAARAIAAQFATKVNTEVGPLRFSLSQKYRQYMNLAANYDSRAMDGGGGGAVVSAPELTGVSLDDMETEDSDSDRPPNMFRIGMFDNPSSVYDPYDTNELV